jgi:hypothetical protein
MRQRTSRFTAPFGSNSDSSDAEETIHAVDPEAGSLFHVNTSTNEKHQHCTQVFSVLHTLQEGKAWWVQCLTISIAAVLSYSYHNFGQDQTNAQIAMMSVVLIVGASPFCASHLVAVTIGAFVGGHNIIGSTGLSETSNSTPASSILWLLLMSVVVSLIWCFVINSQLRLLDGFAGRLGTTVFIGMNLVMVTVYGPVGIVDWNRFYYGLVNVIHVGAEDSPVPLPSEWELPNEVELAIGYVLAVLWLGVVGGATRIRHDKYLRQWERLNKPLSSKVPLTPLNNILVPFLWASLSMLVVNATQYKYASSLYNGFAVGSFVAMASLQKIPSVLKFASVSLVAAVWGLALTPFFVGFAGKAGFTSMLGHVTHTSLETIIDRMRKRQRQQQHEQEQHKEQHQRELEHEKEQRVPEKKTTSTQQTDDDEEVMYSPQRRPSRKHERKLHRRTWSPSDVDLEYPPVPEPKLHHRSWSPKSGDEGWQHPLVRSMSISIPHKNNLLHLV